MQTAKHKIILRRNGSGGRLQFPGGLRLCNKKRQCGKLPAKAVFDCINGIYGAKYFGKDRSGRKNLVLDEYKQPFEVTAVLKDIPAQSTIQFDLLIPTAACPPVQTFQLELGMATDEYLCATE